MSSIGNIKPSAENWETKEAQLVADTIETVTVENRVVNVELIESDTRPDVRVVDIEQLAVTPRKPGKADLALFKESFCFISEPEINVIGHVVNFKIRFRMEPELSEFVDFYVHWGSYNDVGENWKDTHVKPLEVRDNEDGTFDLSKNMRIEKRGWYGATAYAVYADGLETVWYGLGYGTDAGFRIHSDSRRLIENALTAERNDEAAIRKNIHDNARNYTSFKNSVMSVLKNGNRCKGNFARILHEEAETSPELRNLLSTHYSKARGRGSKNPHHRPNELAAVLDNLGIGEVVMVAPEGPQAMAGGLAQVMSGLLQEFSSRHMQVTYIGILYEFEHGNKHRSADQILQDGIYIGGRRLKVKRVGEIDVPIGPSYKRGTTHWCQHAQKAEAEVYLAEYKNIRLYLLRSVRYGDRIYPRAEPDELVKRGIFIARGALEIMANPLFGVKPHMVISNDWATGFLPVLMKTDPRYRDNKRFKGTRAVHMIHNGGKDYHGIIPAVHKNQELFPMLEIAALHYGGLTHPDKWDMINMTSAAIYHSDATLTVSKPYAEQLLSWGGGEGIGETLWEKRKSIFGISNGINQKAIHKVVGGRGEEAVKDCLSEEEVPLEWKGYEYIEKLPVLKKALKRKLQKSQGLFESDDAIVISMIGRMVEQKGLDILGTNPEGEDISTIESILCNCPEVQFVFAGPIEKGDAASCRFRDLVDYLKSKYPDRVEAMMDFVQHDYALELFAASDFALMPSRFEPGGITQLEALACGTSVIARNVGGLSATLENYWTSENGHSFMFEDYNPTALRDVTCNAVNILRERGIRSVVSERAARSNHDWADRGSSYLTLFQKITGILDKKNSYRHLKTRQDSISDIKPED